jgi:hypothetical protein
MVPASVRFDAGIISAQFYTTLVVMAALLRELFSGYRTQTPTIKLEQMSCVLFRFRGRGATLKSHAPGAASAAVTAGHRDKFH